MSWDQNTAPILVLDTTTVSDPVQAYRHGEGLTLPDLEPPAGEIPGVLTSITFRLLEDARQWVKRVLQPKFVLEDPPNLLAFPGGLGGHDAFVGAWTCGGQDLQVVVTRDVIHVLTRLPTDAAGTPTSPLAYAYELLQLPGGRYDPKAWRERELGGLTFHDRDFPYTDQWYQTVRVLTDGRAAKYTMDKYKDQSSAPKGGSYTVPEPKPWFPRQPFS